MSAFWVPCYAGEPWKERGIWVDLGREKGGAWARGDGERRGKGGTRKLPGLTIHLVGNNVPCPSRRSQSNYKFI